jgi:hypothetical protein
MELTMKEKGVQDYLNKLVDLSNDIHAIKREVLSVYADYEKPGFSKYTFTVKHWNQELPNKMFEWYLRFISVLKKRKNKKVLNTQISSEENINWENVEAEIVSAKAFRDRFVQITSFAEFNRILKRYVGALISRFDNVDRHISNKASLVQAHLRKSRKIA